MTGLSQKTAEPLQTQNYGIGGHYSSHWDFYEKSEKPVQENGNRIATVLFYVRIRHYFERFAYTNVFFMKFDSCQMWRKVAAQCFLSSTCAFYREKEQPYFGTI